MKLICIGDSITYGYGVKQRECFVSLLSEKLPFAKVINKGVNGDTTSGILSRSYRDIVCEKPSKVIIMVGTNDTFLSVPLKNIEENIKLISKECILSSIEPIIGVPPPVIPYMAKKYWDSHIDYDFVNSNISAYSNVITKYCLLNSIKYIDFYNIFINALSLEEPMNLYCDGIHPNAKGHKLMFSSIDLKILSV